ncbi:hypothetical protein [Methanoregula formicica]|uniref:Uncharacterized protein n=1 Tax=Methanoregula formicica (strain DSM 22288 / NBRC 105244 / SMSP) TaxID=593750 RepID=L0HJW1_METFS|nr:hypothetical protein [Methanoregula formicica]AGB03354.1 hypothetical protein Metfor_2350 [Methanoregula formicica SMSP]
MKRNSFFIILFCLALCSGCVSDYAYGNHGTDEKSHNLTPHPAVTAESSPGFEQCFPEEASGLEDTYIEFLPGETQTTTQYTFSNTLATPAEVVYTLIPVSNWGEKDPVVLPDWVNVSVEPPSQIIPPCRNGTSTVRIGLTRNATGTSASSLPASRTAFFYLKPATNSPVHTDAGDWLCIQENNDYRTLLRPRLQASVEQADLVVHPGSGNKTSLIVNTQGQGLDSLRLGILAEDARSADVLQKGLLQVSLDPPAFSTRSFRQYSSTLKVNASDSLPSGTYLFTITVHSKSLAQLHIRVEADSPRQFHGGLYKEGLEKAAGYSAEATPCPDCPLPLATPTP